MWVWSSQVSETLKRFAVKVTTASVKERREILSELGRCIAGKGVYLPVPALLCLREVRVRALFLPELMRRPCSSASDYTFFFLMFFKTVETFGSVQVGLFCSVSRQDFSS